VADHALVVGCDAYPQLPGGDLRGAVADALAVRDWLLSRDGGGVEKSCLTFLASCGAAGAQPDPSIVDAAATRPNFVRAVRDLVARTDVGEGDRLYVYLAGHGCRTDPQNPVLAQDAFAFTDFTTDDPPAACGGVPDVVARLRQSRFGVVAVLLDACRNFPFSQPFRLGGLGLDPEPPRNRPYEPRLFLLQSTLPGLVSEGHPVPGAPGVIRGDFTQALLEGLAGAGAAKSYDEKRDRPYVVTWSTLASFVEAAVPQQQPRGVAEGDILLATFPDGYFDPVTLTVQVDPRQLGQADGLQIRVRHTDPSAPVDPELVKGGPVPVEFTVPPRRQQIVAVAGDTWGRRACDAYADAQVLVPMNPGGPPRIALPPDAVVVRDGKRTPAGAITVRADDPAAVVQVRDLSGSTVLSGVASLSGRLAPGSYTAVLIGSDGRQSREPAEVEPLAESRLTLAAPAPSCHISGLRRERLTLPEALQWASDAAVTAWIARLSAGSARLALAVCGTGERPAGDALLHTRAISENVRLQQFTSENETWWGVMVDDSAVPAEPGWFTIDLHGHTLTVPRVASACTAVVVGTGELAVAVFDHAALTSPRSLAFLDRSQSLLRAGERKAAEAVLEEQREPLARSAFATGRTAARPRWQPSGLVATTMWDAVSDSAPGHGLAAFTGPADAASMLPAGPWAVFVDRAASEPPPIGVLPETAV